MNFYSTASFGSYSLHKGLLPVLQHGYNALATILGLKNHYDGLDLLDQPIPEIYAGAGPNHYRLNAQFV